MSEPQERQQDGSTSGGSARRLRNVAAYIDPFLVTRLPQEAVVQGGVIRLFERTVLGFVREPFPDGTKVLVRYEDWLVAEPLDGEEPVVEASAGSPLAAGMPPPEPPMDIPPPADRPPLDWPPVEEPPVDVPPRDVPPAKDPPPDRPPADVPPVDDPPADNPPNSPTGLASSEPSSANIGEGPAPAVAGPERRPTSPEPRATSPEPRPTANGAMSSRQSPPPDTAAPVGDPRPTQPDLFPEDLTDSDRSRSAGSGKGDSWSDAFRPSRSRGTED